VEPPRFQANGFAKVLLSKQNAKASASYKLFMSYDPEAILWLGFISKDKAVQERFNLFLKVWPEARQRIPYLLMQEMRITPELPGYADLVQNIFLELIDGNLTTPEEMRAYLEPHSPPAPPPQVTIKRSRARRQIHQTFAIHLPGCITLFLVPAACTCSTTQPAAGRGLTV
jgi:tRNA nucleotidyltransferase (CCA-adding enzyme)